MDDHDNPAVSYADSLVRSKSAAGDLVSLLDGYRLCARAEAKSERTISTMETAIRLFAGFLESKGLSTSVTDIGPEELRRFIRHLQQVNRYDVRHPFNRPDEKRLSPFTINGYVRAIRAFWSWLVAEELIEHNPLARVRPPRVPQRVVQTLTEAEVQRLLDAIPRGTATGFRDYAIVLTLLDCALRATELVGLEVDDIDFERGLLKVTGKGRKERVVPFGARVAKALWKYAARYRAEPETPVCRSFFLTQHGRPLTVNRLEKRMAEYKARAGITGKRCSPHVLRHTSATLFLQNEGDPFTLQRILGHTRLDMTRHYVNQSDKHIKAAHRLHSPVDNMDITTVRPKKPRKEGTE